ncbi:MAG: histidinol-phosphatase HisJ family protein [Phascolarctobacterium sp.]|uniref:histidinol-phosphatase HisJ family protein n=1 Tax=Phascolarctobacterium sp. TaxID=2049039 RepID=UPI0025CCFE7D|nr:histidinol-phosphatase HisJ family protein [Phascolarctobacterium sp.]MCC8158645.1 histidinol-phosphatase HisJ family protein [Phascolarctobacterium sp.]
MIFDTHMHCDYSCDSHMKIAEAVAAAKQQEIGIVITEHWDDDYPTNPTAFMFDVDEYFERFAPYRSGQVLLGIEIGMQKQTAAADEALAARYPFDYVLASMHCVNGRDLYEERCYAGQTKAEAVCEFLTDTLANLKLHDNFDAFAHIDYMCRYMPFADKELRLGEAPELFDEVFKLLIAKEKPLEINTRRLDDPGALAALLTLYRRYAQLGGKYAVIGSDAHYKEHVGRGLMEALTLADEAGLEPVYFKERKMRKMRG